MLFGLQPASVKELRHIAIGTLACTAVMLVVFGILGAVGAVAFDYTVVLGALVGAAVAIVNFAVLCVTVQNAAKADDQKARGIVKLSYNVRLMIQAAWCVVAYLAPCFQVVAAILPLLFPRVTIYVMQLASHGKPTDKTDPPAKEED